MGLFNKKDEFSNDRLEELKRQKSKKTLKDVDINGGMLERSKFTKSKAEQQFNKANDFKVTKSVVKKESASKEISCDETTKKNEDCSKLYPRNYKNCVEALEHYIVNFNTNPKEIDKREDRLHIKRVTKQTIEVITEMSFEPELRKEVSALKRILFRYVFLFSLRFNFTDDSGMRVVAKRLCNQLLDPDLFEHLDMSTPAKKGKAVRGVIKETVEELAEFVRKETYFHYELTIGDLEYSYSIKEIKRLMCSIKTELCGEMKDFKNTLFYSSKEVKKIERAEEIRVPIEMVLVALLVAAFGFFTYQRIADLTQAREEIKQSIDNLQEQMEFYIVDENNNAEYFFGICTKKECEGADTGIFQVSNSVKINSEDYAESDFEIRNYKYVVNNKFYEEETVCISNEEKRACIIDDDFYIVDAFNRSK